MEEWRKRGRRILVSWKNQLQKLPRNPELERVIVISARRLEEESDEENSEMFF